MSGLPLSAGRLLGAALIALGMCWQAAAAAAADQLEVRITYLTQDEDRVVPLSLLDTLLPDEGLMGAREAIAENQTTGSFLGHSYELSEVLVPKDGDLVGAFKDALAGGQRLFILDLHADQLLALVDYVFACMASNNENSGGAQEVLLQHRRHRLDPAL